MNTSGIDPAGLENVRHLDSGAIRAACPACRAAGADKSGDHLLIQPDGKFGCATHPDDSEHRKEIYRLAGTRPSAIQSPNGDGRHFVCAYDYHDASGKLIFQVCRYSNKDFRQRHPDPTKPSKWLWNMDGVDRVLFRLPEIQRDIQNGKSVFVCEGEKDTLAMVQRGFTATCNPGGAGKWRDGYTQTLRGADIVIVADKDQAGRDHAQLVAGKLHGAAKSVRVIELPDMDGKLIKDASDFFAAGGDASRIIELVDQTAEWKPKADSSEPKASAVRILQDNRPKIQLPGDNRLLSDFARDLGRAIREANLFQRAGLVFTVDPRGDRLVPMTADALRSWLEQYAVCYKVRNNGAGETVQFRRTMTNTDADGVLSSPQFISQLREIERFNPVRMPVRRSVGHIDLLHKGYDEQFKTYTAHNAPPVIDGMPVDKAKGIIDELLSEFGFADDRRSKSVAIAAMFTTYAIGIMPPKSIRPCFIYLANAEGAGKTLLVKLATVPVLGYAPNSVLPKDEDELRKCLLSAVIEAKPVLFFDNFKGHLASASLEGFLTSQDWTGRILGGQPTFRGDNNVIVFVTGNGCTVSPDMRRRSLFCELFLEVERAEDRHFNQPLEVPEILERRTDILSALWTLVKQWHKDMEPKPSRSHSSFPEWANSIAAIVEHAGYGCPLETAKIDAAADVDGDDMRELVKAIAAGAVLKAVTFDELVGTASENGLFARLIPENGEIDHKTRAIIARILKGYDRRLIGEHRFTLIGKGRSRKFQVEQINP